MKLAPLTVGRVDPDLARRQREDEPAVADVYRRKSEDVTEEGAVGFGIFAV